MADVAAPMFKKRTNKASNIRKRPATPPPDLDLELWLGSIERLRARPAARIHLTAHGRALEETLTRGARRVNERASRGLDAAQRAALLSGLRQVIDNLHGSDA